MNKKSGILFFSVLVLLVLGVYYVMATITGSYVETGLGTGAVTTDPETLNLTATFTSPVALPITNVTFSLPDAGTNYQWEIVDNLGVHVDLPGLSEVQNYTYIGGGQTGAWNCSNITTTAIECLNLSASDLDGSTNSTLMVTVNMTGVAGIEATNTLTFLAGDSVTAALTPATTTLITDDLSPRLLSLNVTDGKTVITNGSLSGAAIPQLSTYGTDGWTIKALISDYTAENKFVLAYNCQGQNIIEFTSANTSVLDVNLVSSPVRYVTGTIPYTCFYQAAAQQANVTFSILANDSFNQWIIFSDTDTSVENFTVSGTYDLLRINRVNITSTAGGITTTRSATTTNTELDGSSDYLTANTATIDVEVQGAPKSDMWMVWNDTGAATTTLVNTYGTGLSMSQLEWTAAVNITPIATDITGTGALVYTAMFPLSGNSSSNTYAFWIVANTTGDNNYTAIGGPYRFTVDSTAPSITITPPTDLVISPRGLITYTCKATDSESGAYQIKWQLEKPSETVYTTKQEYANVDVNGEDSITFTGDDTNLAGGYTVQCLAIDNLGNERTSDATTFSVHYSTTGVGEAEGGGAAADIDLSTAEEITITEKQGVISTFTLDGTTVHTIKIKTVDEIAGTVTIVIESDQITITLKTGEMKEVDVDADGANDISVTLNKIIDGAADITTKRLTPLPAEEVPTEEVPPTEQPAEEIPTTPEAASKTWLWILIIVIIVVIGVGYWFMKRK